MDFGALDLDMGKYGLFVWGSYGASALGLLGLVVLSLRARAKAKAAVRALEDQTRENKA